jgi:ATPase subunit of ABC transporter with duplicated ATPase domains
MPQELDSSMTATIYSTLRELGRDDFSKVMNVVASLGSRPERVLDSTSCSPGEWRKLFFGLGVLRQVKLIVLDEPTNHLDLPSIRCLEAALAECAGALLLISHDRMFLEKTCSIHWHIADGMLKKGFFAR